jgi:hypothetical protein
MRWDFCGRELWMSKGISFIIIDGVLFWVTKPHSQSFHLRCRVLVSDWMLRCRLWSMHTSTWRHGCVTAGYWCLLFTLGRYFVLDKIWPSPKHVWNEIILSQFFGSPLARPSVRPPFVSGRRDYCLRVCVKARGGGSKIAISAAAIPLPFSTIRSLQSFQGSSSSVWFDFLKILYLLDIVRGRFSFVCWLVFSGKYCVCRRGVAEVCCPTASILSESQSSKIERFFGWFDFS